MKRATIFVVILCFGAWAEDAKTIRPSSQTCFLPERLDAGLRWLAAYGRFPNTTTKRDMSALKEKIGEWFPDEWRRYVKPDLIPNQEFIAENIQLLTADEFFANVEPYITKEYPQFSHFKEDIMFLRYRAADRDYLIVESGGTAGRFMVFVRVSPSIASEPVNISDVASKQLPMRGVAWISLEGGGCLLINKGFSAFPKPAWEPQPDEWFKTLKRSAASQAGIKEKGGESPIESDKHRP